MLRSLEQADYWRSVRTPWEANVHPNSNDPERPHSGSECLLTDFLPAGRQSEDVPCRDIPLHRESEAVNTMGSARPCPIR